MSAEAAGPISEELQAAAALLYGEAQGVKSATLLGRVLKNIISKPSEEKYRWAMVQWVSLASQFTSWHMLVLGQGSIAKPQGHLLVHCASGSCG
jgi:hypothetical protein